LSAGEVLVLRGDSAAHRKMMEQARPLVEQAVQAEPSLAIGHEALGYYLYREEDQTGADKEMKKAMELGSTSFAPPYYHGMLMLQGGLVTAGARQEAIKSFERAAQINPQFAPAFEGLAHAYSGSPETTKQAVAAGIQAVKLEPTMHAYAINLVYLLLNAERDAEAREMAQRIVAKAASPEEVQTARGLLERIDEHEQWAAQKAAQAKMQSEAAAASSTNRVVVASAPVAGQTVTSPTAAAPVDPSTLMAVDGIVRRIDCTHKPAMVLTLGGGNRPLIFHAADFAAVSVTGTVEDPSSLESCEKWKGRSIRLWFQVVKGKGYLGEITDIAFQ